MKTLEIRREILVNKLYSHFFYRLSQLFLGALLSILPAFLYGCDDTAGLCPATMGAKLTKVALLNSSSSLKSMDVFVFRDDRLQRLDCYQRFDDIREWEGAVVSGSGDRIISVLANTPYVRSDWTGLNSRAYLKKVPLMLEDESRDKPQMYGEIRVNAGSEVPVSDIGLTLCPFAAEITLNSLSCDFTGKAYEGEKLTDIKLYLTNVNAECRLLEDEGARPVRIINAGRLRDEEISKFHDPGIIMQEIYEEVGTEKIYPEISLWCYRSNHISEGPGSPYTRLVIEGEISGQTYYWPININREAEQEAGIWGNRRYIYDIKITCKGSTDPDMPVKSDEMNIKLKVAKWKEKEDYTVAF